jgi:hypothetical protein
MGKEQGEALKKEFKDAGLKMTIPSAKPVKEFNDWYAFYKRAAVARCARNNS